MCGTGELDGGTAGPVARGGGRPPWGAPPRPGLGPGRYARVIVVARHVYGADSTRALVRRLRDRLIPSARFPAGVRVEVGGVPAQGVDYLARAYGAFPWLVLGALVLTYVVLLRGFRSLVLPLKAAILNLVSLGAAFGIIVFIFQQGHGSGAILSVPATQSIIPWIPLMIFAFLFGLSMDYEVFMVSRMRETWDESGDNERAVAHGLERTGRIVTAAAAIMVAAFSGFVIPSTSTPCGPAS